jgi:hypothetical protein
VRMMPFCGPQNISVFHVGIKSEVTSNDIPKFDFAIALYRILAHNRTPLRGWPLPHLRMGSTRIAEKNFKEFWWKYQQYTLPILNIKSQRNFVHWLSYGTERVKQIFLCDIFRQSGFSIVFSFLMCLEILQWLFPLRWYQYRRSM